MKYNPYYKKEVENKTYTYLNESKSRSYWTQKKFKFLNAIPYLCPEMSLFLKKDLFPFYFKCFQRIDVKKFQAAYPDPQNKNIVVVHTPSATGAKGTAYVRKIIAELKSEFEFDYVEIHNQTHQQALKAIAAADIYLDQFIGGSYGMASCEAMSMGKPVFCYLMQAVIEVLPSNCPLVNANPDNLKSLLRNYLMDGTLRNETGKLSRAYMEQYHDVEILVDELLLHLNSVLKKNN